MTDPIAAVVIAELRDTGLLTDAQAAIAWSLVAALPPEAAVQDFEPNDRF